MKKINIQCRDKDGNVIAYNNYGLQQKAIDSNCNIQELIDAQIRAWEGIYGKHIYNISVNYFYHN